MKLYTLIDHNGLRLRQKNPLANDGRTVSADMYAEHERLYIADALKVEDLIPGKDEYTENEIDLIWQIKQNGSWVDCTDHTAAMVETTAEMCQQIYRVKRLSSVLANNSYQDRVTPWLLETFGEVVAMNVEERTFRFLEEAIELAQATGCTRDDAFRMVAYVYSRPIGDPYQEVGGVMITLAALCNAAGLNMHENGEMELQRINTPEMIEKIRNKQVTRLVKAQQF